MAAAQPDKSILRSLLEKYDFKIACSTCTSKKTEITYSLKTIGHQCHGNILLAKAKDSSRNWRYISRRPAFPNPSKYDVCHFFVEGSGCTKHKNRCTFATSIEEVAVWNFQKHHKLDHNTLLRLLSSCQRDKEKETDVAKEILAEFSGEFQQLCGPCFHSSPQRIAGKRWNNLCTGESAHTWNPVLIHCFTEGQSKKVYNEIRHWSAQGLQYCSHVARGAPCWHRLSSCPFAHSEVEMAVWKMEAMGKLDRKDLVLLSQKKQLSAPSSEITPSLQVEYYCKACLLTVSSKESFINHCASHEHAMMIAEDSTTEWKHRPPPLSCKEEFVLCDRPETCDYGDHCIRAHSVEELKEWIMRHKEAEEIRSGAKTQGLMSYRDILLQEYRNSSNEVHIISDHVDDVCVTHDMDLSLECEMTGTELKWIFQIKTERSLGHVALLKQEPGCTFSLGEVSPEGPCIYARGDSFSTSSMSFEIPVYFTSINPGLYDQWLVFDFNMRPVLLQKLQVRVGEQMPSVPEIPKSVRSLFQCLERWHRGNRVIIPCIEKREKEEDLLKEYKPPHMNLQFNLKAEDNSPLNCQNYRERMHNFLYREELAQEEVVSRLSLRATISLANKIFGIGFGIKIAVDGELFAAVPVHFSLTPNTPEGYVLKRSVYSALLGPVSVASQNNQVYEADIVRDASSENVMHLQLSKRCCHDLKLQNNMTCEMEVQFQISRLHFCEMHEAIDLLPEVEMVLPDMSQCCVPAHKVEHSRLNAKQQAAMSFILGESDGRKVAPLLIYGPFGTGKTYTLATAAKELVRQPGTKILICTHTNSSADLYVKDHFHQYVNAGHPEARPLRIKANKKGVSIGATDDITLQYCHRSKDGQFFMFPDRATVDQSKIIITTAALARLFNDLKLPPGYFTHILIDEASQMLECEALMPLSLAGKVTRVVLAGDHMQMGPKLFSLKEEQWSGCTLLNHLFRYYQKDKNSTALRSRIIFNENYRSTKEIVDFVSTYFYVGKNDAIKASGTVPPHPQHHPLRFHHVRGQCHLDSETLSWFNPEETASVVQAVENVLEEWPSVWGSQEQRRICVLSEGRQVVLIRKALRRSNLSRVIVENLENVQGKQFRVVVMSTVHTRDSLQSSDTACLDFFNDARVLNTAMTRAQSQVIVVGDAAALCMFGRCPKIWKSYIEQCIGKGSMHPAYLTVDYIEQEIMEISKFQKVVNKCYTEIDTDPAEEPNMDEILQELNEDQLPVGDHCNSEEQENFRDQMKALQSEAEKDALLELVRQNPRVYKLGELVLENFNKGYVIPFVNPVSHIIIEGKKNIGLAFSGDEVVVEIHKENGCHLGRVLGTTKKAKDSRVLVCFLEDTDTKKTTKGKYVSMVMVPINHNATKIRVLVNQKNPNSFPIWKFDDGEWKINKFQFLNEKMKRNHVFVVEVVRWMEKYIYPLGNVIDILPVGTSMDEALKILDNVFRLVSPSCDVLVAAQACAETEKEEVARQDLRDLITFTVDPPNAEDLDDAISVRDLSSYYELGVHIADVASVVHQGDPLDEYAKQIGATYYIPNKEPRFMFPKSISIKQCSLLPGHDRRAISLIIKVEKATGQIIDNNIMLSRIISKKKLSYEEAEDIIERTGNDLRFETLEDCVGVAYHFSRAHRKARLWGDWCYSKLHECRALGRRKSHQMIEELMIMFNNSVSEYLIGLSETSICTPLRCQAKPKPENVKSFQEKYEDVIPLSSHLTYHIGAQKQPSGDSSFCMLTSVWKELQSAARMGKFDKIIDLIATDDIHPQLLPATREFKKLLGKSYVVRANSAPEAKVGHYSLQLDSYTQASSPIRRYLDVIIQRLLHGVLTKSPVKFSPQQIDLLCQQFDKNNKKANDYQKKAEEISFAINLTEQNTQKVAFVIAVNAEGDNFKLSFPFNNDLMDSVPVMYSDLQLENQPVFDKKKELVKLMWKRRIYSIRRTSPSLELKQFQNCNPCTIIPKKTWESLVEALRMEDWDCITRVLTDTTEMPKNVRAEVNKNTSEGHFVELTLSLKPGDTLEVQMAGEKKRGFLKPTVQLLNINAQFEVCVEHTHDAIVCFSACAKHAAKSSYQSVEDYINIWKPLCEMESAATAVDEGDSIIIEDMEITWKQGSVLEGSFFLPINCIKEWAVECNLARCYLCIRKRNLKQDCSADFSNVNVDPKKFTWVAHGVTTRALDPKKTSLNKAKKVEFYISHRAMKTIPECVLQENTTFTIELIPKSIPDIRKESAINNLNSANELVQKIALGQEIPRGDSKCSLHRWEIIKFQPSGLPVLNSSQVDAIEKAVAKSFTLIQGPPGTGKTVVGAYIVRWFYVMNSKTPRLFEDGKERDKKEVILYCGPSNKSVDVVAEFLMKFGKEPKLLRVYSRQVEMLEYPYPGSIIQLSHKSLRQERSKTELRSITLHHRIRAEENPFSSRIRDFDRKIDLARKPGGEQLTDDQVEVYKNLLNEARLHELKKHDIILCTCTAASTPNITKAVSARQILIDECAMATEPQALVPLVSHKPEKIVLIGDHKQLRPIVKNQLVQKLGMRKSLFERYFAQANRSVMLDTQYRMHEDICEFPSMESYDGKLKTEVSCPSSVLQTGSGKRTHILFGQVCGEEISLIVTTAKGNENSKVNQKEVKVAVQLAQSLVMVSKIPQKDIAVLSPYNAQVSEIKNTLKKKNMDNITVCTITKSQGSEWRYVILSTVRSCPSAEIQENPAGSWLAKHIGFVGDSNQVNVGITRAREGLCIIGNQELLRCSNVWKRLLNHYTGKNCVVEAEHITVYRVN